MKFKQVAAQAQAEAQRLKAAAGGGGGAPGSGGAGVQRPATPQDGAPLASAADEPADVQGGGKVAEVYQDMLQVALEDKETLKKETSKAAAEVEATASEAVDRALEAQRAQMRGMEEEHADALARLQSELDRAEAELAGAGGGEEARAAARAERERLEKLAAQTEAALRAAEDYREQLHRANGRIELLQVRIDPSPPHLGAPSGWRAPPPPTTHRHHHPPPSASSPTHPIPLPPHSGVPPPLSHRAFSPSRPTSAVGSPR